MKNQTNETMTDLTATVKAHWDACLDVNGAWCDFTNKIGVENTRGQSDRCEDQSDFTARNHPDTDEQLVAG